MIFCVTEEGKYGEMCFFIDRLNINFRSQFLLSFLSQTRRSSFFTSPFFAAFATRLFSHRWSFGTSCKKTKPDSLSFFLSSQQFHILPSPLFSQHLSVRIFIIQPITVFKLKANENNPHSWLASFDFAFHAFFSLSLFNWILVSYKIHLAGDFKMSVQTAARCWGVKWPILRWIEWKM